jgi:adhesin transport system membrane fusion protein
MIAWPVMILLAVLIVWARYAQLDEVSVATGDVVPQGKVKVIQHLEGGIIDAIHVRDGDSVKEGSPLIQLNLASSGTNREELQVRLDGQILVRARYDAEANGKPLVFPEGSAQRRPKLLSAQRRAFRARKNELESKLRVTRQQIKQKQDEVRELETQMRATKKNLTLGRERLKMSKSLLAEGLTPKIEHLQLEAEVESLEGERRGLTPAISRARGAVEEARQRMQEERLRFRREAEDELGKAEQAIARIGTLLNEATAQDVRSEIKSPIDGVVKNMRYNTLGGVVSPGEPIMEIVPTGGNLVIDAKLSPLDRGYVKEGQPAVVKISSYDFVRYGSLDGKVILVAADTSQDEQFGPFYRVVVQTEKSYLGEKVGSLPIMPGMEATVDIHTGQKSVMDYLVKPVLKLREEAFRER